MSLYIKRYKLTIEAYVDFYNNRGIHRGTGGKTPQQQWNEYETLILKDKKITIPTLS